MYQYLYAYLIVSIIRLMTSYMFMHHAGKKLVIYCISSTTKKPSTKSQSKPMTTFSSCGFRQVWHWLDMNWNHVLSILNIYPVVSLYLIFSETTVFSQSKPHKMSMRICHTKWMIIWWPLAIIRSTESLCDKQNDKIWLRSTCTHKIYTL